MWNSFGNGNTLGQKGSEQGEIVRDDEHSLGARITLEKDTSIAPFAITCGIYGWMVHTRIFANEQDARSEYEKMKTTLTEIIALLENPEGSDQDATENAVEEFVRKYP